jgi:hypothetical protein
MEIANRDFLLHFLAILFFTFAIVHTLLAESIHSIKTRVELPFFIWAIIYLIFKVFLIGPGPILNELVHLDFKSPLLLSLILLFFSHHQVKALLNFIIDIILRRFEKFRTFFFLLIVLTFVPLLGSLISEPAAMTISAFLVCSHLFTADISTKIKYQIIGILLVNISIGGILTPYASPPMAMVATKWNWNLTFTLHHFGKASIFACLFSTVAFYLLHFKYFTDVKIICTEKHFLKKTYFFHKKDFINSFSIALFMLGLMILGEAQHFWIAPLISKLKNIELFLGAFILTSITDNAAITYLGSLENHLSILQKIALMKGAVLGGGLTIMANAPNPIGLSIFNEQLGENNKISAAQLFLSALIPTIVAIFFFLIF